jgi:hypothetical protein
MGYNTHFEGILKFTRPMTPDELAWIERITDAGHNWTPEISNAVWARADAERNARSGGPRMVSGPDAAELAAKMQGFIIGKGLSADYAVHLCISDDRRGLVYCCEKTYDIVGGINFIIVNARTRIPDFGLTGTLVAHTEFEPYHWSVKIGCNGMAYADDGKPERRIARAVQSFTSWLSHRRFG